jgi:hypothetical protein
MSRETELEARNVENLKAWRERWNMFGGSFHWQPQRQYRDLRNQHDLHRWRVIEFKRRQTGLSKRSRAKVVNLAAWELRRLHRARLRKFA